MPACDAAERILYYGQQSSSEGPSVQAAAHIRRGECILKVMVKELSPCLGGHGDCLSGREPRLGRSRAPLIVHVDDDLSTRELLTLVLNVSGYPWVISFDDGETALHYCLRARPSLVITDIARPGMDGLTLCRMLRAEPSLAEVPLLIHSAHCGWEISLQAEALRAGYLPKPCSVVHLVDGVQQALAGLPVWREMYRPVSLAASLSR